MCPLPGGDGATGRLFGLNRGSGGIVESRYLRTLGTTTFSLEVAPDCTSPDIARKWTPSTERAGVARGATPRVVTV